MRDCRIIVTRHVEETLVKRLEVAGALGADAVVDVEKEDALSRVLEMTDGRGVDVVIDCTVGAGTAPTLLGIEGRRSVSRWDAGGAGRRQSGVPFLSDREADPEGHDAEERAWPFLPGR